MVWLHTALGGVSARTHTRLLNQDAEASSLWWEGEFPLRLRRILYDCGNFKILGTFRPEHESNNHHRHSAS